jgi:DnaK suppressor protein
MAEYNRSAMIMTNSATNDEQKVHAERLNALAQRLRAEIRATLLRVDADRYALLAGQVVHDTKDQALAHTLLETGAAEIERDARELADVELAQQRLAAGRYGRCTVCDAVIPAARLEAWPTAKRCQPCQAQHEQQRRG